MNKEELIPLSQSEQVKRGRDEIHDILGNLRQRIEFEDDDFHYDAVLEALAQILNLPHIGIIDGSQEIDIPDYVFFSEEAKSVGFTKRSFYEAGWRKICPKPTSRR